MDFKLYGITKLSCAALIILFTIESFASPDQTLANYLDAIRNRDWQKAESFWSPEDIARSKHLGIEFADIKAKYDCASPLVYLANRGIDSLCRVSARISTSSQFSAEAYVDIICPDGDSASIPYYLMKDNDKWRLCSSLKMYTKQWHQLKTRYYILYYTNQELINTHALKRLDSFTDSLGVIFEIAPGKIRQLEKNKIEYYLCTEEEIKLLTGFDAQGMTSMPFDAIITRHLPHPHEITHMMINYSFGNIPLHTLPVVQEGLACYLGGRWGKAPKVIDYWGASIVNLGYVDLDSILTANNFNNCPASLDGAYAVSSLFAGTLIENYGMIKFRDFYKVMSGRNSLINSMSMAEIIKQVEATFGESWNIIKAKYNDIVIANTFGGIKPPGSSSISDMKPVYSSKDSFIKISAISNSYIFEINLPNDKTEGSIFFYDPESANGPAYKSWQFAAQHPDKDYGDEHLGIMFSAREVGLYDYRANVLLAKYVLSFTPDPGYYDEDSRIIKFSLDRDILVYDLENLRIEHYIK
jgi:hypothetical protein